MDAIAMAMVNGNRRIVTLLLEAEMNCDSDKYGIRMTKSFNSQKTEEEMQRDKLRLAELKKITNSVINRYKRSAEVQQPDIPVVDYEALFEELVLHRYDLHRDFNFLPRDEYLFHFLFNGCGAAEATWLKRHTETLRKYPENKIPVLAGRINELVLTEMVKEASMSPLDGFLEFLWARQDGQGRPPFHIAAQTEENPFLLRGKALTLTRPQLTVPDETLKKIIRTRDGAGRTAVHRAVALGKTLEIFLHLEKDVQEPIESEENGREGAGAEGAADRGTEREGARGDVDRRQSEMVRPEANLSGGDRSVPPSSGREEALVRIVDGSVHPASARVPVSVAVANIMHRIGRWVFGGADPPSSSKSEDIHSSNRELKRLLVDEGLTGHLQDLAREYPIKNFCDERKRVAAEAFKDCLREEEFDADRRSLWKSDGDIEYRIDLGRLSKSSGLSSSVWSGCTPLQSAILHNVVNLVSEILRDYPVADPLKSAPKRIVTIVQAGTVTTMEQRDMAAIRGDVNDVWKTLRHCNETEGIQSQPLSLASKVGRYDLLQWLINEGHNPLKERFLGESPLHYAVTGTITLMDDLRCGIDLCSFVSCEQILDWKEKKKKSMGNKSNIENETSERDVLHTTIVERQKCINLLIQKGCDIFEQNQKGEILHPSRDANPKFLSWWHKQQTKEFTAGQNRQATTANVIIVTAALVITASYIGPLQPPRNEKYIEDFIIWNMISFYLGICTIIAASFPYIPMPHTSMITQLHWTRRMAKLAVLLLYPSLYAIGVAFFTSCYAVILEVEANNIIVLVTSIALLPCLILPWVFVIQIWFFDFLRRTNRRRMLDITWTLY